MNGSSPAKRVAVIGGGISGLSAAHRLLELSRENNQPVDVTLFDAGDRVGGILKTESINGFLVEQASDSFITNKPWAVNLCERLGLADELIPTESTYRRSLVLRKGRPVPVPEGFMLLSPAKVWPVLRSPIFSPWGKLRMGLEYFVPRKANSQNSHGDDESLAAFVRRRFGREALERLVQPLVGGIYTSDPEKLSLAATMPRFLNMEREHRSLIAASRQQIQKKSIEGSGARYGLFAAPKHGVSQIVAALEKVLTRDATIRLQTEVQSLRRVPGNHGNNTWELKLNNGQQQQFDAVIVTLRSYQAADLLRSTDESLANCLNKIEYASSAIVVGGYNIADFDHPLDAFGLVIPAIEKRKVLAVSFGSRKFAERAPAGKILLRTFVGGAMQPDLFQHDDDQLKQIVQQELQQILGFRGTPEFEIVARYKRAMPQYHLGHVDRVDEIFKHVDKQSGLAIAGNAYRGVGIPDCVHSGEQAAASVYDELL